MIILPAREERKETREKVLARQNDTQLSSQHKKSLGIVMVFIIPALGKWRRWDIGAH